MKETIKSNQTIIARVAIMGAKRGCGWRYCEYEADQNLKSGYRFIQALTNGMYPNLRNHEFAKNYEQEMENKGYVVVQGRPNQHRNAPEIIS